MGHIFEYFPNLSQNWFKFKKIIEKSVNFDENLAQNWNDWYMDGPFFFQKWYMHAYGSTFRFSAAHPY